MLYILVLLSGYGMLHTYLVYPWMTLRKMNRIPSNKAWYWAGGEHLGKEDFNVAKTTRKSHDLVKNHPSTEGPSNNTAPFSSTATLKSTALTHHAGQQFLPRVSVLMAVHNEEMVLEDKLNSLLAQDYAGEYRIYVGSDNSSDGTNAMLARYAAADDRLNVRLFTTRQGKPGIVNQLAAQAAPLDEQHIFILTDASVMLQPNAITELVGPMLTNPNLAMADARMIHTGMAKAGIGQTEDLYIGREVKLKQAEGKLWGYTIGPFGGCYALRANYFRPVPANFLVDDFFLCLSAYEQGGRGISVPTAHCYEAVGQEMGDEFRRKVRISSGNWQNAVRFKKLWWPPTGRLGYAFFSHKLLRWLTPLLLILLLVSLFALMAFYGNYWAAGAFFSLSCLLTLPPLLDYLLSSLGNIHWFALRSTRYFLAMNLALLVGFFRYLKGIQSNVWQPSKRH